MMTYKEPPEGHKWKPLYVESNYYKCQYCDQIIKKTLGLGNNRCYHASEKIINCNKKQANMEVYSKSLKTKIKNKKEIAFKILNYYYPKHKWIWLTNTLIECSVCGLIGSYNNPTNYKSIKNHFFYIYTSKISDYSDQSVTSLNSKIISPSCAELRMEQALK